MKAAAKSAFVVATILVGVVALGSYLQQQDESAARTKGFANAEELKKAAATGVSDPAKWREMKQARDRVVAELSLDPADEMKLSNFSWKTGGFGSVAIITATIENFNNFTVKDITVKCSFGGKSGIHLSDVEHVIYDTIKSREKRTFKDINIGFIHSQSASSSCRIKTARRS